MKNLKLLFLYFSFFVLHSSFLIAQNPEWMLFNKDNSCMPGNGANIIVADKKTGEIWAYAGGLIKFDGNTCNTFSFSLPGSVKSIAIDNSGNKWIGTVNGLVKYDNTNWTVYNTSNSAIANNDIESVGVDTITNNIWVASFDSGALKYYLSKFDGTNWTNYTVHDSIVNIKCITIDKNSNVWIGSDVGSFLNDRGGLFKFDGSTWTRYFVGNSGLPNNDVYDVAIDKNDTKWIGIVGDYPTKFDGVNWSVYGVGQGCSMKGVNSIDIEFTDDIWWGSTSSIAKYDGANWTELTPSNSGLPYAFVKDITVDKNGNKWVAMQPVGSGYPQYGVIVYKEGGVVLGEKDASASLGMAIKVYPNPSKREITVEINPKFKILNPKIVIYDIAGKKIKEVSDIKTKEVKISIDTLTKGIYFVKLYDKEKELGGEKIVVQ